MSRMPQHVFPFRLGSRHWRRLIQNWLIYRGKGDDPGQSRRSSSAEFSLPENADS